MRLTCCAPLASRPFPATRKGWSPQRPRPLRRIGYGPVILMAGAVKPSKVTVYVKLTSSIVPGRMMAFQFGLGQRLASSAADSGRGPTLSAGTVSLPFLGSIRPLLSVTSKVVSCDSIGLFGFDVLGLKQSTIAEYVALRFATAFVLPTPAISYELQLTLWLLPTVHSGV